MIDNKKLSVIILCGGEGMRLRPITNNIPKPLVQINDKPILFYIINHLLKYQISDYIIATGYKSEKIEDFMNINSNNMLAILLYKRYFWQNGWRTLIVYNVA